MNIFEISQDLDSKVEELAILDDILGKIESGKTVSIDEETMNMIIDTYTSIVNEQEEGIYFALLTESDFLMMDEHLFGAIEMVYNKKLNDLANVSEEVVGCIDEMSYLVKQSESDSVMAKDEATRFNNKSKMAMNKASNLKKVLMKILDIYGETGKSGNRKVKTDKFNLWTVNRKSLEINEEEFDQNDDDCFATITLKVRNIHSNVILESIKNACENIDVDKNENIDNNMSNELYGGISIEVDSAISYNKSSISSRIKGGETVKGACLKSNTSLTIK